MDDLRPPATGVPAPTAPHRPPGTLPDGPAATGLVPSGERLPSPARDRPGPPATRNAFLVYVADLESPRSRRAMSACLHRLAAMLHTAAGRDPGAAPGERFPWAQLRAEHTAALRALIGSRTVDGPDGEPVPWSPAYRNLHLSALRGVLRTAWRLGEMSTDDYQRAAAVRNFRGTRLPAGRSVHAAEFSALLAVCGADPSAAGTRDAALLAVLYTTGARRAEVAALRREDYDPGERSLRITGKGDKQRLEYVHEGAAALLGAWLVLDDRTAGPLFKPVHRSGAVQHRPMTDAAVRNAVVKRRKEASLPPVTPHDFRRTFIGDLLDQGVDLATVQHLVGHASPATTARYDRRPERRRRNAVDTLPFPSPPAPPA
ncbi:tyrosine-type recombinase/integrase [Spirillospora sp. NPDC047418]